MSRGEIELAVSRPPQYHDRSSTARIMWTVTLCLLPAAGWGVYVFGLRALAVLLVAVGAAVVTEALAARMAGQSTLRDGSAVLAGLLIGMSLPPGVPYFIPIVASAFAMLVVKWSFGGLGANWMNPALAGRVFVFFSWTSSMTTWAIPRTLASGGQVDAVSASAADAVTAATPLGIVKAAHAEAVAAAGPMSVLRQVDYPVSTLDGRVADWLNMRVLGPLGVNLPDGYVDLFVGNVGGSIGEVSALLLLLGTVVLFARRIITWHVPASYFVAFALLTRAFGGVVGGQELWTGDVLFAALTGGFVLTVFYMATDTVTSPLTGTGMVIYGAGAGFLTFVLRTYGSFPESTALAVILMNVFVPLINRATGPRRFGVSARRHASVPAGEGGRA